MLHVLDGHCPQFCETIANLPRSKTRPEDADTKANDHLPDAFRYMAMAVGTYAAPVIYNVNPTPQEVQRHIETLETAYNPQPLAAGRFAGDLGMHGAF
jgi:hypothetical protein